MVDVTPKQSELETYLGDGLYASFDGYQIRLRAPQGGYHNMEVFLEPSVYQALVAYATQIWRLDNGR